MQQYQLKQSSTLNLFTIGLYCLVIAAIFIFLHGMILLAVPLALLAILFLFKDQSAYRLLKKHDPTIVTLYDDKTRIELNHPGDRLQYDQFRLFTNRWFLILQMKNKHASKNVMLVADQFRTINEYLRFRYQIINMNRNRHAT